MPPLLHPVHASATIFQKRVDNPIDLSNKTPDFQRTIDTEHLCESWTTSSFLEISKKRRHASFLCYWITPLTIEAFF